MSSELVEAGQVVLRSASGIERLADGIGRSVPRIFSALLSHSEEAYQAYVRFLRASERMAVSADEGAARSFLRELDTLEALAPQVKGLNGAEHEELLAALRRFRRTAVAGEGEAAAKTTTAVTRPKIGTVAYDAARSAEAAKIQRAAVERMRAAAADRSTAAKAVVADAIDMLQSVIGPGHTEGWDAAFTYLADNIQQVKQVEERYAAALSGVAKGQDQMAAAEQELKAALQQRQGLHSKLKGLLGEAYASRCEEFRLIRDAFLDLARHRVDLLNAEAKRLGSATRWKAVTVRGDLRIDGLEVWDEAVLIVEELGPGTGRLPRAELVMAAQYKVERDVSALGQITRDVAREAGDVNRGALLSFTGEGGATFRFNLMASAPTRRPKRFFFNASGEKSVAGRAAFRAGQTQAQQGKLKASVDQFNAVADQLMASVPAALQ